MTKRESKNLLTSPLKIVNIGLEGFADELRQQDVDVIHVDWKPPAGGNPQLAKLLAKLGA